MKVVSNTSPLIFLSKLAKLDLLQQCFAAILVPEAVSQEFHSATLPDFLQVHRLDEKGRRFVLAESGKLHAGELSVMALAQQEHISLVLLDDARARKKAEEMNLKPLGTLGVLLLAHKRRLLTFDTARACCLALVEEHGMFMSKRVLDRVVESLREQEKGH